MGGKDMSGKNSVRKMTAVIISVLSVFTLAACGMQGNGYRKNSGFDSSAEVRLKLTGNSESFRAMEEVIGSFCDIYPNCTIEYEYVQDYEDTMTTRLANNDDVDLFITNNITASSPFLPYALELGSQSGKLSLEDTYDGLIRNFTMTGSMNGLYAIPLGGEVRGMYVNRTLLDSQGLSVPQNYSELMECCRRLKEAGYIPFQGNPGRFGQLLMYPYICSLIADSDDYQSLYNKVNSCEAGVSEIFREPMSRLYDIVKNGYYNYKYVETEYNMFTDASNEVSARSFLNIVTDSSGNGVKKDDTGMVAFMPDTMSFKTYLDKVKDDYHSGIDYEFILSPVGDDGGYAYLSPAGGIAVNKNSANTDWALEFLNYLFTGTVNEKFAREQNIIPNTKDAMNIINSSFNVSSDHVCQLGEVTFDYVFYDVIKEELMNISKGNNPKYMQEDGSMYGIDHYMEELEASFAKIREGK